MSKITLVNQAVDPPPPAAGQVTLFTRVGDKRAWGIDENGVAFLLGGGIDTFRISVGRNSSNSTDIWLRDANGTPTNTSPIRLSYASRLVMIVATGNQIQAWDAEVYSGAVPRAGGVPLDASKDAELVLVAAFSAQLAVSVNYSAGTEIGVFMRGTGINFPRVDLYLERV